MVNHFSQKSHNRYLFQKNKDLVVKAFRVVDEALKDDSYPWHENHDLRCLVSNLTQNAIHGVKYVPESNWELLSRSFIFIHSPKIYVFGKNYK